MGGGGGVCVQGFHFTFGVHGTNVCEFKGREKGGANSWTLVG